MLYAKTLVALLLVFFWGTASVVGQGQTVKPKDPEFGPPGGLPGRAPNAPSDLWSGDRNAPAARSMDVAPLPRPSLSAPPPPPMKLPKTESETSTPKQ